MSQAEVSLELIQKVRSKITPHIVETPLYRSSTISDLLGKEIHFKLENLQFTASFKERGAVAKLNALTRAQREGGVITLSAGNHAQALACHAQRFGVRATIVMPRTTPIAKIEKTRYFDPEIVLQGTTLDDTLAYVTERQAADGLTLIHPFNDPYVIAGQGSLGLEILEQLPDVDTIIVPIGGGGLISGISIAAKSLKPELKIVGVQSAHYCPVYAKFHDEAWEANHSLISIAEGISVKYPGELTMPIIERLVDDVVVVEEHDIETAMYRLLDIEKTLVEGAGAATLAAVDAHPEIVQGKTLCIVSGGNVDPSMFATVIERSLVRSNRIARLHVTFPDIPGSLSKLTKDISETDSNIIDVFHRRSFGSSTLNATVVEITVQIRGEDDKYSLIQHLRDQGHNVVDPDRPPT